MIDILLATYNGEKYLSVQLDSLLKQTCSDFRILIRDDGSKDRTMDIVNAYAEKYPQIISVIQDQVKCGSPGKNFFQLMTHAESEYIMFCDQDDFWFPEKLETMLAEMKKQEAENGTEMPLMVFSDYIAADDQLHPLKVKEENLQIAAFHTELNRLLVQNYITGCTIMLNKAAYTHIHGGSDAITIHDWWAALYVSACGKIVHLPKKLMYYRQHGNNAVGAVDVRSMKYRLQKLRDPSVKTSQNVYYAQAEAFLSMYGEEMPEASRRIVENFTAISGCRNKFTRMKMLVDGGYLKSDFARIAGQLYYI